MKLLNQLFPRFSLSFFFFFFFVFSKLVSLQNDFQNKPFFNKKLWNFRIPSFFFLKGTLFLQNPFQKRKILFSQGNSQFQALPFQKKTFIFFFFYKNLNLKLPFLKTVIKTMVSNWIIKTFSLLSINYNNNKKTFFLTKKMFLSTSFL